MHLKNFRSLALWALAALMLSACASQKEPAQAAISQAETALEAITADAQRFVPEQLKDVQDALAAAKANFDKGDFKAALAGAKDVTSRIADVGAAASTAKQEAMDRLNSQWNTLSPEMQQMVDAIQSRVDMLSKSRKLPKNIDKASFDSAKSGLDTMKQDWSDATQAFTAGNIEEAVTKARAAQQKGTEVMGLLGMQAPTG